MKNITLLVVFVLTIVSVGKAQSWKWARGTRGCNNYGRFSTIDSLGNIYVTGETFTGMKFVNDTIPNVGYTRVYLSKFDSSGNLLWVKANTGRNTTGKIGVFGLTTDLFGNTYMLGGYDTVIAFDGNTLVNAYLGVYAGPYSTYFMFLAKFDSEGNNLWVKSIGDFPVAFFNGGNSIRSDCSGDVYIATNFFKDATIGSYNFANSDTAGNTSDMLLLKLDSSGAVLWARSFGDDSEDYITNIALTPDNEIYFTGAFFHNKFIVGHDTLINTSGPIGRSTTFISKFDNNGNPIWTKPHGSGAFAPYVTDLIVSSNSDVFASGYYWQGVSVGGYALPYAYGSYGYLAKYNDDGDLSWLKILKGNYMYSEGVTLDGCGNAWILGHFGSGTVTTNDTIDGHVVIPPAKNLEPLYVAGWSSDGTYIGTSVLASGGRSSYKISMVTDRASTLYIIGNNTQDTLFIANDTLYGNTSMTNMFIAKYDPGADCAPYHTHNCLVLRSDDMELKSDQVDILPNPASDECLVVCNSSFRLGTCTIYNIAGQLVKVESLNTGQTTMILENLPTGIYLFKIQIDGSVVTKKVAVVR